MHAIRQKLREALEEETGISHQLREKLSGHAAETSLLEQEVAGLKDEISALTATVTKAEGAREALEAQIDKDNKTVRDEVRGVDGKTCVQCFGESACGACGCWRKSK